MSPGGRATTYSGMAAFGIVSQVPTSPDGSGDRSVKLEMAGQERDLRAAGAPLVVARGYIARPDDLPQKAVEQALREVQFNLGEAYRDADRHAEAYDIFRALTADNDLMRNFL
jgi:hypothetical protein